MPFYASLNSFTLYPCFEIQIKSGDLTQLTKEKIIMDFSDFQYYLLMMHGFEYELCVVKPPF